MKINIGKINILFLSYLYFPSEENVENKDKNKLYSYEYENLLKNKEIEKIELIEQNKYFNKKAEFIYNKNKFKIEAPISNKKLIDFQRKFDKEKKELNEDKKDLTIISKPQPKLIIYFNLSDIEFIFYKANFASIINNDEKAELFFYLKKFEFECEITRKNYYKKEIKYYFPLFPDIDIENILNNLKFHDVVFSFSLEMKYLFDIMFIYEMKFKLVKNITIKKINYQDKESEDEEEKIEEEKDDDLDDFYDINISLDINNHDINWYLLCLVSEHFISYFNLIFFLNKYHKELNELITKDEYLFIILLRDILRTKYTLSKIKIKFFNPESFYEYIKTNIDNKLSDKAKKEYDIIKNIYTTDEIREKYFRYNLVITPLTCEFKIPFLKRGILLVDKYITEFKSYDLIYFNFQNYKKISINDIRIDFDIYRYFVYYIINQVHSIFNLNYGYLGTTFDDKNYQRYLFIKEEKINLYEHKSEENDILLNEDIAAYSCLYKSIKRIKLKEDTNIKPKIKLKFNSGIISSSLKQKIKAYCKIIHNFNSCYGIIGDFSGNFSVVDEFKYNYKNRIIIQENKNPKNDYKNGFKDRIFYILNIFKYNSGIIDNETINLLNILNSKTLIKTLLENSFNINIENIYNKVPISKLKFFLNIIKNKDKENIEFIWEIKKYFLKYQYDLISKNIIDIPNSAILNGIIDEYNIMKNVKEDNNYYICVIIEKENGNIKYLKGNGIIFKVRKKYLNQNNNLKEDINYSNEDKICRIKFFDIEKYESTHKNTKKYEKIKKMKNMKNVIIFPRNSKLLEEGLNIKDISLQEYFISWNKDILDIIDLKKNENLCFPNEKPKEEIKNILPKNLKIYKLILEMHHQSRIIFQNEYKNLLNNKIKIKYIDNIDYKNLTKNLIIKKNINLNDLEFFYLEYIPKCTLVIKNIINIMKELMQIYSVNNIIDLLLGNINIQVNSNYYIREIENINNILITTFNNNIENLISEFNYLKNQEINSEKYLYEYKEKMFIISTIIYNICNFPERIEKIVVKYNKIIAKIIKHKYKTSKEKFIENNNNIRIKDFFFDDINIFGIDYYLKFESDELMNDNLKEDKDINMNIDMINNKKNDKNKYEYFFEDFKIILLNQKEIKKYYIPELLFYKYLKQLNVDFI